MENRPTDVHGYDFPSIAAQLASGWVVIVGLALGAAAVAVALSAVNPHRYKAEALMAVARSASVSFDERFSDDAGGFPARVGSLRTYPELAQSDGVAATLFERRPELTEPGEDIDDLLNRIRIRSLAEGTLVSVEARARSPDEAAELANAWADIVAEKGAVLFGSAEDRSAVEAACDAAALELEAAGQELAALDAAGGVDRIRTEVESLQEALRERMDALERLRSLRVDLEGMRAQAAAGGAPGASLAMAEAQRAALSALSESHGELRVAVEGLGTRLSSDEIDALAAQIDTSQASMQAEVDDTVQRLSEARAELTLRAAERRALERRQLLADERHLTLARKVDELAVAGSATRPELRVASAASPVDRLPLADWGRRALVAALVGALLGAGWVLWRGSEFPDA